MYKFHRTTRRLRTGLLGEKQATCRLNHDTSFIVLVQVSHLSVENRLFDIRKLKLLKLIIILTKISHETIGSKNYDVMINPEGKKLLGCRRN